MAGRLEGMAAIVTGGASGFGSGIARCMAREGAKVLVADMNPDTGAAMAEAIREEGGTAAFQRVDVTDRAQVDAMTAACRAAFGTVDCLVANAGLGQRPSPLLDTSEEEFDRQFAVNVKGVFHCCRSVLPVFRAQGNGNIIITASGIAVRPRPNLVVYGATKGAVLNFTKGLAEELAPEGFRVNALCPAAGDTPMLNEFMGGTASEEAKAALMASMPLGRLIQPEDMGNAAVFLASETEARTITGMAFPVDSGRLI
jgi:3-oxoacyl-[acyl-carrier protein] reductase